jgi:glycosyltransferase involved in cell wall biosynthesis
VITMPAGLEGVRLVFVLPSIGLGGAERQAFFLARHLREREGADARFLSLSSRAGLAPRLEEAGIPYEFFEPRHGYRSRIGQATDVLRFVARLRRMRAQILMPYCMFQNVICGLTRRAGGARVCIWNQRDEGRSRMERWVERIAVRESTAFISNSTHGAEFVVGSLGVPAGRVNVVANGVVMPAAARAVKNYREALGLPANAFVACMVANLHSNKDHATLIAAWRSVVDRIGPSGRAAHLILAGSFQDTHEALVAQVEALGLERHVSLLGQIRDVDDLLRSSDLAVFSSYAEGIPNAVLEAMAHGLAVAATDYPGIREAVGGEGAALLAPPRDAAKLAEVIVHCADHHDFRIDVGERLRRRVAMEFSVESMATKMTCIVRNEWHAANRRWAGDLASTRYHQIKRGLR